MLGTLLRMPGTLEHKSFIVNDALKSRDLEATKELEIRAKEEIM